MVLEIYCKDNKTIYIIHSPTQQPTAQELEEWLEENKERLEELLNIEVRDVMRLNTGVDWDAERAEEILDNENCIDLYELYSKI